jgi:myo-inositol-1(or 4)-monophosphatase
MTYTHPAHGNLTEDAHDPRDAFLAMFEAVRAYLLSEGSSAEARGAVATNPKGEATRGFDATAERIALGVAGDLLGSFRVFSEEAGELTIGADPRWTLVLDPCDGSNNFRRGFRAVGFAVAALPIDAPLDPDLVEYAMCGDIFTGTIYSAARGRGATRDGLPCTSSTVGDLRHALVGVNLGRERRPEQSIEDLEGEPPLAQRAIHVVQHASTVRRAGATVLDLCYVAQGAYDAYVDVRTRLTPENFMAPALVLREAGGRFTGVRGQPLGAVEFTQPYSVLAAGNDTLLAAILELLHGA